MGKLNMLQGNFTGKLGNVSGTRIRGKNILKTAPFSKAPPTTIQTASVLAFTALNRVSAKIAKLFWPYLGLTDKKILKHNAVARWLKKSVETHTFDPFAFNSVISEDMTSTAEITDISVGNQEASFTATVTNPAPQESGGAWIVLFFNDDGYVSYAKIPEVSIWSGTVHTPIVAGKSYYLVVFRADFVDGVLIAHGLSVNSAVP